jgi:uncharacterized protein
MKPRVRLPSRLRLPIKLGPTTNGEYEPLPPGPALRAVHKLAHVRAEEHARRVGMPRREFLGSLCGAATVLGALNLLGCRGGRYTVRREDELDPEAARARLAGDEVIFDVQTHHVAADRPWHATSAPNLGDFLESLPTSSCGAPSWVECYARDPYLKEVFLDSDTQVACLSALWGDRDHNPLHAEEAARTRDRVAELGRARLRIHGIVEPQAERYGPLEEHMRALVERWDVAAWKLYPLWGPDGKGYTLTSDVGRRTIETGLALGRGIFAVHKGLPLPGMDPQFASALDVGPMAREYPQATFLIYHSGFEAERREEAYDPRATRGVDALIRGCKEAGIGPGGNVYAELGSLWRELMKRPDEAAHALGKLLLHFGEDRILWGTDAIWYGSPQDQIQAFRAFEITGEYQGSHGYPPLTAQAKRKIFGANAMRVYGVPPDEVAHHRGDRLQRARDAYHEAPQPSYRTYGPRSRRELLALLSAHGGPGPA